MAANEFVLDTGPLVALIDASDQDHAWSRKTLGNLRGPLVTCEAVLSETLFLLREDTLAAQKIGALFQRGLLVSAPVMESHATEVLGLMQAYRNVPMSLADASLVKISDQLAGATIITLDSDFLIYRRQGQKPLATIMPPKRRR